MVNHNEMANAIRFLAAEAVEKANSGHPGMPMGMADVATVLYSKFMKFDPKNPKWFNRDRFVLSAGHGSTLLYSLLYLTGYADATIDELKTFRQLGSKAAGHPEFGHMSGIDTTTGPLGQGITNAVGMALAERLLANKYGADVVDHYTYAICGDGCLMEGISEEAISLAGHLQLSKLIVMWDDNNITIDGAVSVASSTDQAKRFEANGWDVQKVDGHNPAEIEKAIEAARKSDKPSLIACKTIIGYGSPKEGTEKVHGSPLGADGIKEAKAKLGWSSEAFVVPTEILAAWRDVGAKGAKAYAEWKSKADTKDAEFARVISGKLPKDWKEKMLSYKKQILADKPKVATRKSSQMALEALIPAVPELLGGSADLTSSNLTKVGGMKSVARGDLNGNYIHYGIREQAMAAAMNGICLHGGFVPYGGAFFVFSDYLRPCVRLSAIMEQGVIYVMTHDSIGVGEDGPTHQPVEHAAAFRAMPNVNVFRPCDAIEATECWELAVENRKTPSILVLSRQNLPCVRTSVDENKSEKGAYVLSDAKGERKATIIATGSEVEIALDAQAKLREKGIETAVVTMPCWELFDKQSVDYKKQVLGTAPRVAVEALSTFGWEKYVGIEGKVVGMTSFGASAPAGDLYKHFGITAEAVADAVVSLV